MDDLADSDLLYPSCVCPSRAIFRRRRRHCLDHMGRENPGTLSIRFINVRRILVVSQR